jgi:hypothetical protein
MCTPGSVNRGGLYVACDVRPHALVSIVVDPSAGAGSRSRRKKASDECVLDEVDSVLAVAT